MLLERGQYVEGLDVGTVEAFIRENRKDFSREQRRAGLYLTVWLEGPSWHLVLTADNPYPPGPGRVFGLVRDRVPARKLARSVLMLLSSRA